jgi:N-methylhydantoinase A
LRVAIDTGGTFTDCVALKDGELHVLKLPSTPDDPACAVLEGFALMSGATPGTRPDASLRHGTTVGTNTMLEQTGARVAFVTTEGFEDTIAIGRQTRARLYDWFWPGPVCLAPRELRFGVRERVGAEGTILQRPSDEELARLAAAIGASGAEAVAVSLLFSFANPETELRVEATLRPLGLPVSVSHRILPEFREYERASTTVVNAYLAPRMSSYLMRLSAGAAGQGAPGMKGSSVVEIMQSSGGIIGAETAAREPVRTVLSGPAGGLVGACRVARWAGFSRIIGFDMGGTSTDVFLSDEAAGGARLTRESVVAGVPVGVPMLDIHTAGAGGGSLARFDAGGMLRVGPESAGAEPGPICFGRGARPTVTDANLLLGRLDAESFLGGGQALDRERTERLMREQMGPLATVEEFAAGIVRVVETAMERAIRVISVDRGHDPREFALVAFGGGGPLHACSVARALRMKTVVVPAMPGALSALGILLADTVRDYSRTVMLTGDGMARLPGLFAELERTGEAESEAMGIAGELVRSLDVRYRGQGYELNVPWDPESPGSAVAAFHRLHERSYGFADAARPIEVVNLRLRMVARGERYEPSCQPCVPGDGTQACYARRDVYFDGQWEKTKLYRRDGLSAGDVIPGPAMITEYTAATVLDPGDQARVDGFANLIVSVGLSS